MHKMTLEQLLFMFELNVQDNDGHYNIGVLESYPPYGV